MTEEEKKTEINEKIEEKEKRGLCAELVTRVNDYINDKNKEDPDYSIFYSQNFDKQIFFDYINRDNNEKENNFFDEKVFYEIIYFILKLSNNSLFECYVSFRRFFLNSYYMDKKEGKRDYQLGIYFSEQKKLVIWGANCFTGDMANLEKFDGLIKKLKKKGELKTINYRNITYDDIKKKMHEMRYYACGEQKALTNFTDNMNEK